MTAQTPLRVLVIDDDPSDVALISAKLKHSSFGTFESAAVHSMEAARARLAATDFDVVLLDMLLPDVLDMEGLEELVSQHPTVAVVELTGVADDARGLLALQMGAQDYIVKQTYHHQGIYRRIVYAVARHRQRRALPTSN